MHPDDIAKWAKSQPLCKRTTEIGILLFHRYCLINGQYPITARQRRQLKRGNTRDLRTLGIHVGKRGIRFKNYDKKT